MADDFTGTWYNQLGSSMTIKVARGSVSGTYHTGVGEPKPEDAFDIVGLVYDDLISFIVRWKNATKDFGSMTAWVGQMTKDDDGQADRVDTLWHLVRNVPDEDEPKKLWGSVVAGADRFRRTPFPAAALKVIKAAGSEPVALLRQKVLAKK